LRKQAIKRLALQKKICIQPSEKNKAAYNASLFAKANASKQYFWATIRQIFHGG